MKAPIFSVVGYSLVAVPELVECLYGVLPAARAR